MADPIARDERLTAYADAARKFAAGEYEQQLPIEPLDEVGALGMALTELAHTLAEHEREYVALGHISERLTSGFVLDEILSDLYRDMQSFIPYERIGVALIDHERNVVLSRWAKAEYPHILLGPGVEAPLAGSTLEEIVRTGQPRILNDLEAYLAAKPTSISSRIMVQEGIRSSLTCPLIADGRPIGFLFFSSVVPNTYAHAHVETFTRIAAQVSHVVEKSILVMRLVARQQETEQKNAELVRLSDTKDRFLGMAAHDLRNPIGTVRMTAQALLDPSMRLTPDESSEFLRDVVGQCNHMLALIDDLLDVSAIESGKLTLELTSIDAAEFARDAARRHAVLAAVKDIRVVLGAVSPGTIVADRVRLRQVVDNLVSNAVKYSPKSSTVTLDMVDGPEAWLLSVRDQGPGLAEQDRAKLFKDFSRLSARPTGGERSTGLGLAITKRIVDAHGGTIGVDSVPGEGATFWVRLPHTPV